MLYLCFDSIFTLYNYYFLNIFVTDRNGVYLNAFYCLFDKVHVPALCKQIVSDAVRNKNRFCDGGG